MAVRDWLRRRLLGEGRRFRDLVSQPKPQPQRNEPKRAESQPSEPAPSPAPTAASTAEPEATSEDGWVNSAAVDQVRIDRPCTVQVGGSVVSLFRAEDDKIYALDDACPHEGGPLGMCDRVEGYEIACPFHDWRFDVRTGRCVSGEDSVVPTWDVEEREGRIWVRARSKS